MNKIELLAGAGNMERLKTAFYFGADAAYIGGKMFGLRAFADNFSLEEIDEALKYAHSIGKKLYVTVNIFAHEEDIDGLKEYIGALVDICVDALIISDPGIFSITKSIDKNIDIHVSTQANTTNYMSANFWYELGAKRIILARELGLEEIKHIRDNTPKDLEIEAFVHGAMCMSYSGRCLLSSFLEGRDPNRGQCVQSCRWEYALVEKKREGQYFPIAEDERGTYILNSKDLMMLEHVDKLREAGISSFKIEGRMKTAFYTATTVRAYRKAIDIYNGDPKNYKCPEVLLKDIEKASHRPYCTGFYFGKIDMQNTESSEYIKPYDFIGVSKSYNKESKQLTLEQRGKFSVGDMIEILSPNLESIPFEVEYILNEKGEQVLSAPTAQQIVTINCPFNSQEPDILQKRNNKL